MKYILTVVFVYFLSAFTFKAHAQGAGSKPFFAAYFAGINFNYNEAYIKIDDKEATYDELMKMQDSNMLRVELYSKKTAVKAFGKETGRNGVILFTTKKYKPQPFVFTTEDSVEFYKKQGIEVHIQPDKLPTLDGDTTHAAWVKFLQKNLRADTPTERGAPMGVYKVMVKFVVNEDGSLSDVSVDEDAGYGTGAEAKRVMSKTPLWQPAIHKGKPVSCREREPIIFVVLEM